MKQITSFTEIDNLRSREIGNISAYLDGLAAWTYTFIGDDTAGVLKRLKTSFSAGNIQFRKIPLTPEEIGIIALASRQLKSNHTSDDRDVEDLANYQFMLQSYLGIADKKIVTDFCEELIATLKGDHAELIPTLVVHHAQILALKIAYDALKPKMNRASRLTRVLFGLICIEFMRLHIRLYLIEPLARTPIGSELDWIYMLDRVFDDFSSDAPYNKESIRKKSVPAEHITLEPELAKALSDIKGIRDHVALLKKAKLAGKEHKSRPPVVGSDEVIQSVLSRLRGL